MKRLLILLLALVLCMSSVSAFAIDYPVDSSETLVFWRVLDGSISGGGYTSSNETPGFIEWQRAAGIKVQIQEYADNTALVLAINGATELPDLFMLNPSGYNGGIMGMVNDELIIEITSEMLEKSAPDYWSYVNKDVYMDLIKQLDGKMYGFAGHIFEDQSIYRYWRGFIYREDLLQKAGWEKFPQTKDEFYQCLVDLKTAGIPTPLVFQGKDDLREMIRNGDITSPFNLVNASEYHIDGTWYHGAYQPEYKDVLSFLRKLREEQLISVDYLTMEPATSQAMFCNGEAAIFYGNNSRLNTFKASLAEGGRMAPGAPLRDDSAQRGMYSYADLMVTMDDTTYITTDCKNPELALQFLNFLYTAEGDLVRNFGVENESYIMEDGQPKYTELITNNPNGYGLDGMARSYALINWPGIHANNQLAQRHPEASQIVAYEQWSNTDHDTHVITHTNVLDEYLDEYTNLWVDIDLYINECRAKFISGEMDLDTEFDAYIARLKSMGMDRVTEIKQITLDAYNAR